MKGLNLSTFKKVSEDKESATMMHKDGHTIKIAKKPLSALQRKQLEKLPVHKADGGEVEGDESAQPQGDQPTWTQDTVDQGQPTQQQLDVSPVQEADRSPAAQSTMGVSNKAYEQEKAANLEQANAIQNQGGQEAQAIQDYQAKIDAIPTQSDLYKANLEKSNKLYNAYSSQQLNPDHYWQSHSKIAAGIGMLFSGIGSGLTGQPNLALQQMNNGINRDIEAQKNSQDQKMNLWKMNRQMLGDEMSADLATKNQMLTGLKYKIDMTAANAKGPIAMAQAHAANARINQEIAMNSMRLSWLQDSQDGMDPAKKLGALTQLGVIPQQFQGKIADEIDAAQNTVANAPGILQAFDQASQEVRPMTGLTKTSMTAFVPGMKSTGQKALIARLGPTFKDVEGTVRQAAMDNMEHNVTPNFGDSDETIAAKRNSLIQYLRSKSAAAHAKANHIDLERFPSTRTSTIGLPGGPGAPESSSMEGRTATNPKTGERIIFRSGKWVPYGKR